MSKKNNKKYVNPVLAWLLIFIAFAIAFVAIAVSLGLTSLAF